MFPIVSEKYNYIVGIDTHALTHTAVVVNNLGIVIASRQFKTTNKQINNFINWAIKITGSNNNTNDSNSVLFAIEGTSSYGELLTKALANLNLPVVEVKPPKTKTRGTEGKTDLVDAKLAAVNILGLPTSKLIKPRLGSNSKTLRILLGFRRNLTVKQTMDKNSLTALLRSIDLGFCARKTLKPCDYQAIASWSSDNSLDVNSIAKTMAVGLANSVLVRQTELDNNKRLLAEAVNRLTPGLLTLPGFGPITIAQVIYSYSYKGRITSAKAFCSLAGVAPIPASSGKTCHYRLNHYGDRQLNNALTTIVVSRMRTNEATKQYVNKRTNEGLAKRDIKRSLKRYVARSLFKQLENYNISLTN